MLNSCTISGDEFVLTLSTNIRHVWSIRLLILRWCAAWKSERHIININTTLGIPSEHVTNSVNSIAAYSTLFLSKNGVQIHAYLIFQGLQLICILQSLIHQRVYKKKMKKLNGTLKNTGSKTSTNSE